MPDRSTTQDEFNREKREARYGSSGNEDLYGEGQYTNQGKPDQRTKQARQLNQESLPPQQQQKEYDQTVYQGETAEQANRELEGKLDRSKDQSKPTTSHQREKDHQGKQE